MRRPRGELALGALALVAGCKFAPSNTPSDGNAIDSPVAIDAPRGGDAGPIDAGPIDARMVDARMIDAPMIDAAPIDAPPPCVSVTGLGVHVCPVGAPAGAVHITSSTTITTDNGATNPANPTIACAQVSGTSAPPVCMIYATTITLDAGRTFASTGSKPLVLFATSAIDIEGTLDAASHIGVGSNADVLGPGPSAAACGTSSTVPQGNGGGAGGSYATKGASGGAQHNGGAGGTPGDTIPLAALDAGCPGQGGGNGGGTRGGGGGVILVIAPKVTVGTGVNPAQIDASGGAGHGATANGSARGGGGGGAGGLIVIQATMFAMGTAAAIFANGGHGGGGSTGGNSGTNGSDPSGPLSGGGNGQGGNSAGAGAVGAHGPNVAGGAGANGGNSDDGGGGAGGGSGYIVLDTNSTLTGTSAQISPTPTTLN